MTQRRRILLAELRPQIPQPPVFAAWSTKDKHADIALSGGNLTASKTTTHASNWACVRATVPMRAGQWYWEVTPTYTGAAEFAIGVADPQSDLSVKPGTAYDYLSLAVWRNGEIHETNFLEFGSVGPVASGDVLRFLADYDAGYLWCSKNGGPWVGPGGLHDRRRTVPVVGILRPAGSTASITANFGATPFAYPVPDSVNPGVYNLPTFVATTLRLGSEAFDGINDVGAQVHYAARIAGDQDVEVEREGSCWVWGGQSISRRGQLVVVNADGALDAWRDYLWRDAQVVLRDGYADEPLSTFGVWGISRVDSVEFARDTRIVLTLADPIAWLDRPLQPELYPSDQLNAQAAGQPIPIVYGEPLYCAPVRLDNAPAVRNFQIADVAVSAMTAVFDNGDPFGGPDDPYTLHNAITAANGGDFTGWSGSPALPANWARLSNTPFGPNDKFVAGAGGGLRCLSKAQAVTGIYHTASSLLAGRRYRITFNVTGVAKAGTLIFRAHGSPDAPFSFTPGMTGSRSVVLDVRTQVQLQVLMHGGTDMDVTINNLRVSTEQVIDWSWWPSSLDKRGFTLANKPYGKVVANPVGMTGELWRIAQDVMTRVALPALTYSTAGPVQGYDFNSFQFIDITAPYRVAAYISKPRTALALLREMLDSWCGWITTNRLGQVVAGRVTEPSRTAFLTLDSRNIVADVIVSTDRAKGLTLRLAGARNHSPHSDGEIATSVPADRAAELRSEYTMTAEGAAALAADAVSPAYAQAVNAAAQPTLLRRAADLQAEANRVATLWRPERSFYIVTALLGATQADSLEPGQTVRVIWPRWGLSGGKNLLVVGVRSRFFSRRVELKLWG